MQISFSSFLRSIYVVKGNILGLYLWCAIHIFVDYITRGIPVVQTCDPHVITDQVLLCAACIVFTACVSFGAVKAHLPLEF